MSGNVQATPPYVIHEFARCCFCDNLLIKVGAHWWCPTRPCREIQRRYAIAVEVDGHMDFWHVPLPKQAKVEMQTAPNVMFAGMMGPGKSHWGRRRLTRRAMAYEGYVGVIVRDKLVDVQSTHGQKFKIELAELEKFGVESKQREKYVEFPQTGGVIHFAHMSTDDAVESLLGPEYDDILLDEAATCNPDYLPKLMARARSTKESVIADGGAKALPVTNPGGPASAYLRDMFIRHTPDYEKYPFLEGVYDPADWVFIEASLRDNPYLDKRYKDSRLSSLDRTRYMQVVEGNWDVFEGMAFPQFEARKHEDDWHVQDVTIQ